MFRGTWLALGLCLALLGAASRSVGAKLLPPGKNSTEILQILARDWSGSALDDRATERGASYTFYPGEFTYTDCLPQPGRPSRCPVDMVELELINEPPEDAELTDGKRYNFTLHLFGDIAISSPNSAGYFGMPKSGCAYERNHTTSALFNLTTGRVVFTIEATLSDRIGCSMQEAVSMKQRCNPGTPCHANLIGKTFEGIFDLVPPTVVPNDLDPSGFDWKLRVTIGYPYKVTGVDGWADQSKWTDTVSSSPTTPIEITEQGTISDRSIYYFILTSPVPWRPHEWFRDRTATILSTYPPFGPEEGGTTITVIGREFPSSDGVSNLRNGSIVLHHSGPGGDARECCESRRLSDTMMTCRLPRVSCLSNNPSVPCPEPGSDFAKQTVSLGIRPEARNYDGATPPSQLDDFVEYEGTWELADEDVYGGIYVPLGERIPGETHILEAGQATASGGCCPVCPHDIADRTQCQFTIQQSSRGVYRVEIPEFLTPGTETRTGVCDRATDMRNTSILVGIEKSVDPAGFTPANPLSVTSCIDQVGPCAEVPRISIRETCKQLVWSLGFINSYQVPGTTTEVHEWITNGKCDRRMRCVAGKCLWTKLAERGPDKGGAVFERRTSSPQVGMQVDYKNTDFDTQGFFTELAPLIGMTDPARLQLLSFASGNKIQQDKLGTTFAVRAFEKSEAALCVPENPDVPCSQFSLIIYLVSDNQGGTDVDHSKKALEALAKRASAATGDPEFRMINLMNLCVDTKVDPIKNFAGGEPECYKIQFPGVLQFDSKHVRLRVKEGIWAYANLGVTRTGGSDLGVTVDYATVELTENWVEIVNETRREYGPALGLGQDFFSKRGQLRWEAGDAGTKFIVVPITDDSIMELSEVFQVRISDVVNASMVATANTNGTQTATVIIVGINNTPQPTYINRMSTIIGIVCGAATIVPCMFFAARFVREFRRDLHTRSHMVRHSEEVADVAALKPGLGGTVPERPKKGVVEHKPMFSQDR